METAFRYMIRASTIVFCLLGVACAGDSELSYLERRAAFTTNLTREGPGPGSSEPAWFPDWELSEDNIQEVTYPSDDLTLKALVYVPPSARSQPKPALVYLGGGFEVGPNTLPNTKPFIEAGFVVMTPMLRGANGNPGNFEVLLGEVDDAAAAARWLAARPNVASDRVYVLGLSMGGAIAATLSLLDDVPARLTGSIVGLFDQPSFSGESGLMPFDETNPVEWEMRLLVGNLRWMKRAHHAYVFSADRLTATAVEAAIREMDQWPAPLEIVTLPGDNHLAVAPAVEAMTSYLEVVQRDIRGTNQR